MSSNPATETVGTPSPAILDSRELELRWQAALTRHAEERHRQLLGETMVALACVPTWTQSLARRVLEVNAKAAVPQSFAQLVADGSMQELRSPLREEQTPELIRFVMPTPLRAEVLSANFESPGGRPSVWHTMQELAITLRSLPPVSADPEDTRQWAELMATAGDSRQLADRIDGEIRNAKSSTDIYRILEVTHYVEPLFRELEDSSLDVTLLRAGRRLELLHRNDDDRAHLRNFLVRAEQRAALDTLVGPDDEHWALHLVGAGGVGKTMLLRYICSEYAIGRFAVARVDFDYLNPDYPRLAPGLLLWAFSEDLRAYATDARFDELMDQANNVLLKLHEELRANVTSGPTSIVENSAFQLALEYYTQALRTLNLSKLLILDTCEELARIRSDGSMPDSVRDTFQILEALHRGLPGLRVIFSGRRPLAGAGYGWTCPSAPKELPVRDALRLHEIRGFTHAEAARYLKMSKVPAALHAAIIARCPDVGRVVDAQWDDPSLAPAAEQRCNPYDLKLYAEWASEDPPPDARTIATSTAAQYVEFRILRRLRHPELERLLPVIAILGHIDDDTLRQLTKLDEDAFEHLQITLRQQEWTSVRLIADVEEGEPRHVYTVDPGLRTRLRSYAWEKPAQWREVLARACRYLMKNTLTQDLSKLDWTDFDATLNALDVAGRPERLARWWQLVEQRLRERDPQWRVDLLKFLCASEDPAAPEAAESNEETQLRPAQRVRPAILGAYAAALASSGRTSQDNVDIWAEVLRTAGRYPLRKAVVRIRLRAATGRLIASDSLPPRKALEELASLLRELKAEDIDSLTAIDAAVAAGATVDKAELNELAGQPPDSQFDASLAEVVTLLDALLEAMARESGLLPSKLNQRTDLSRWSMWMRCLRARARMRLRLMEAARLDFDDVLARIPPGRAPPSPVDHLAEPDSLYVRVLLEYARVASPLLAPPGPVLNRVLQAFPDVLRWINRNDTSLDLERLTSVCLRLLACERVPCPVDPAVSPASLAVNLGELWHALETEPRAGTTAAQRAVPPLCCTAAEELAAFGELPDAVTRLRALLHDASRYDEETRREIERAYLRIVLRFRLFEVGEGDVESLERSLRPMDRELLAIVRAFDAGAMQEIAPPGQPELLHAKWRALSIPDPKTSERELQTWLQVLANRIDPDGGLDGIECALLLGVGAEGSESLSGSPAHTGRELPEVSSLMNGGYFTEPELIRLLRKSVLTGTFAESDGLWVELSKRLGSRRAAEQALEEATALALRLPEHAFRLALQARRGFREVKDGLGALRAGLFTALTGGPNWLRQNTQFVASLLNEPLVRVVGNATADTGGIGGVASFEAAQDFFFGGKTIVSHWFPLMRRCSLVRHGVSHEAESGETWRKIFATDSRLLSCGAGCR